MKPFVASFEGPSVPVSVWKIFILTGTRDKEIDLDTLKKESPSGGFWQVLSPSLVGSFAHLAWVAYSTIHSVANQTSHYSKPDLEFLTRVAGHKQLEKAVPKVGVQHNENELVVVWVGPEKSMSSSQFLGRVKKWGLRSKTLALGSAIKPSEEWSSQKDQFGIEQSALVELQ